LSADGEADQPRQQAAARERCAEPGGRLGRVGERFGRRLYRGPQQFLAGVQLLVVVDRRA
jgi:hypothetical protein